MKSKTEQPSPRIKRPYPQTQSDRKTDAHSRTRLAHHLHRWTDGLYPSRWSEDYTHRLFARLKVNEKILYTNTNPTNNPNLPWWNNVQTLIHSARWISHWWWQKHVVAPAPPTEARKNNNYQQLPIIYSNNYCFRRTRINRIVRINLDGRTFKPLFIL